MTTALVDLPARMRAAVGGPHDCWIWPGARDWAGYGHIGWRGRRYLTHRLSYELLADPIPEGLVLDHLCRVTSCFNPAHLEPVTRRENTLRGIGITAVEAALTHCQRGHPFSPENTKTYRQATGYIQRECKTCRFDRTRPRDESSPTCRRGHPYQSSRDTDGYRRCLVCKRDRAHERRDRASRMPSS